MKKEFLIFIPFILILLIQFFDKEDKYVIVQYIFLAIMILAVIVKYVKK